MAEPPSRPLQLFVTYSHDPPEHKDRVLAFCNRLRPQGMDPWLDQYEDAPTAGWPRWCAARISAADFVLMVCTEAYERHFRAGEPGGGLGVAWEGSLLTQEIYESGGRNHRVIPVLFPPAIPQNVPLFLRSMTRFEVGTEEGFQSLYRHLTGRSRTAPPPLGPPAPLPPFACEPQPRYEDNRSRRLTEELEAA